MNVKNLKCLRCGNAMEPGFVMDRAHYSVPTVASWVEGAPERSIWSGLKTQGRDTFPVISYRCEQCGYLEAYARVLEQS